jgi:hypothetical protein
MHAVATTGRRGGGTVREAGAVASSGGWRDWYYQNLSQLMLQKLPPEAMEPPELNEKRKLSETELTNHEETFHISRQHPVVLLRPVLGLLSGLVLLTRPPGILGLLVAVVFAGVIYRRVPLREGFQERLIAVLVALVLVVAAPHLDWLGLLVVIALIVWPIYDFADWWHEILVVTNKRVINMHGIFTVNRPSVKLSSISFSNCISGPIGNALHYGTIDLDTSSQRDHALSNIEYVSHAYEVWRLILQLHSEHRRELGDQSPEELRRRRKGEPDPPPAPGE